MYSVSHQELNTRPKQQNKEDPGRITGLRDFSVHTGHGLSISLLFNQLGQGT